MKQMTCVQMGGPATCSAVITGNTSEEMVENGTKHVNAAHPDIAEQLKKMSKADSDKWRAEFQEKWEATPEM
jgi:hypothetical protein